MVAIAVVHRYKAEELIFRQGDAGEWVYWIREGMVKVTRTTLAGKDFVTAVFGSGEMFGLDNLYFVRPLPFSARAVTETEALAFKKESLTGFLTGHPGLAMLMIELLSDRLVQAQLKATELACEKVEQRFTSTLARLMDRLGNVIPFSQRELAEMTGTTTETVIRRMRCLREEDIVATGRRKIIIKDPDRLVELSREPA